jgi:FdhE protein
MDADIQRYAQAMPEYGEQLNLLQRILDFQAALAEKIEPSLRIDPALARKKWQAGQPLFAGEPLSFPPSLVQKALADLRFLLPPERRAQVALDRLLASSFLTPPHMEALLHDLLADSEACIQRLADATSADFDTMAFLLGTGLSPFFQKLAAPYRELVESAAWRRGLCPMCGSEPWMARLTHEDGRRMLACALCHTEWAFDRLRCPFCESDGQPLLRHFTLGSNEAHRVDCCDRCRRYIKTVDERVSGRRVNLLVEDVITTHLDMLAREDGYQ